MKLIKTKLLLLLFLTSNLIRANIVDDYFYNVLEEEKNIFNKCVIDEKLIGPDKLNTNCEISKRIKHATYIIENKEKIAKADILDGFKKYQRITNNKLLYPSNMERKNKMGYVILDFDIDENGNTKNIKIQESKCGNMHSPLSNFKPCRGFNSSAINYIKSTKYKPTLFKETAIYSRNAKYRLKFILDSVEIKLNSSKSLKEYKKLLKLIKEKKFKEATKIAIENKDSNNEFLYELSRIKYIEKDYNSSINYMNLFFNNVEDQKDEIPEYMLTGGASIMIESLYNIGDFEKVVKLSEKLDIYLLQNKTFEEILAIANMYIGASHVNLSNIEEGIYYLVRSKRMSTEDKQMEFIQNLINNVSNLL
tara:strand:- start:770 stop:1861 length:1092 start_codon:yes stop_codon:yes gene_type:complete